MISNNPDINDLLYAINKKHKRCDKVIKKKYIIIDLQILSLKKLENIFINKKRSLREFSKILSNLEYNMTSLKVAIENSELDNEFNNKFGNIKKVLFISLLNIHIKEIVDIRKTINKEGRQFNVLNFIKAKRKKLQNKLKKKLYNNNLIDGPISKRLKKNKDDVDDNDDN